MKIILRISALFLGLAVLGSMTSCNNEKKGGLEDVSLIDLQVSGMHLKADNNPYLKNTFFSIDQRKGLIFNAVKLPFRSKLDSVVLTPSTSVGVVVKYFNTKESNWKVLGKFDTLNLEQPLQLQVVDAKVNQSKNYKLVCNIYKNDPTLIKWVDSNLSISTSEENPRLIAYPLPNGKEVVISNGEAHIMTEGMPSNFQMNNLTTEDLQNAESVFTYSNKGPYLLTTSQSYYFTSNDGVNWTKHLLENGQKPLALLNKGDQNFNIVGIGEDNSKKFYTSEMDGSQIRFFEDVPNNFPSAQYTITDDYDGKSSALRIIGGKSNGKPQTLFWETTNGHDWLQIPQEKENILTSNSVLNPVYLKFKNSIKAIFASDANGVVTYYKLPYKKWEKGDVATMLNASRLNKILAGWIDTSNPNKIYLIGLNKSNQLIMSVGSFAEFN